MHQSPVEPEIADAVFSLAELPLFQPPQECPAPSCPLGPVGLVRETKAPTVLTETFPGFEGQNATLVILASNPKTTTVKAWLNEVLVLLPSRLPQSPSDEVRVPVTLSEENILEVRLSAKPGTQVAIWVESNEEPPIGSGDPPSAVFRLTSGSFAPTDDMSSACTGFGEKYRMADWTDVVIAVNGGATKEDILNLFALILNDGAGFFQTGFPFFEERHYALSGIAPDPQTEASVGTDPDMFWLTSKTDPFPVLCTGPAS
jgi:hypothetical protein